jgi:hypothetical protein
VIELYDHNDRRISLARFGRRRRYKHFFGGTAASYGFTIADDIPLHLIYIFDTSDPLWPISTKSALFPLCYGFVFGGVHTAYRVHGRNIELVLPENPKPDPDLLPPHFPAAYEAREVVLNRKPYNPRDPEHALMNSAIFGLSHVPAATLKRVASRMGESGGWDGVDLGDMTREQYLREHPPSAMLPLLQGAPDSACVYPECRSYGKQGAMKIIAFHMEGEWNGPINETQLWHAGGEIMQTIFQMCADCGTIHVSHQCT